MAELIKGWVWKIVCSWWNGLKDEAVSAISPMMKKMSGRAYPDILNIFVDNLACCAAMLVSECSKLIPIILLHPLLWHWNWSPISIKIFTGYWTAWYVSMYMHLICISLSM
jgi:hypothetical protein